MYILGLQHLDTNFFVEYEEEHKFNRLDDAIEKLIESENENEWILGEIYWTDEHGCHSITRDDEGELIHNIY